MNNHQKTVLPFEGDPDVNETAKMLSQMAGEIKPDATFVTRLERRLAASHPGPEVSSMFTLKKLTPTLLWVVAGIVMVVVIEWAIRSLAPEPVPAARNTPEATLQAATPSAEGGTPVPPGKGYDYHGTTLYLAAALPESPSEAAVFLGQPAPHATVEDAVALAQRFGIDGSVYESPGESPGTTDFLVTDGKQSLRVRSASYFSYTADIIKSYNYLSAVKNPEAETIIDTFLQSHGFNFAHRIEWTDFRSAYLVVPLTSEGTPLRYEDYAPPMLLIALDHDGNVATLQASLMSISKDPVGQYGILSADKAFQRLLDANTINGVVESMHGISGPLQQWTRTYPTDQPLTIYGNATSQKSVQPDQPSFIQIDGFPVVGQVSGLDQFSQATYVEATGRFIVENGIEKFSVDSWKVSDVNEDGLIGTLQRENDQVTITTQDGAHYVLPDVQADVPMPFENAFVVGTREGDLFQWKLIDDRMANGSGGGGGGGGGSGFYKLNLSGTPVAFPTPTAAAVTAGGDAAGSNQYVVQAGDTLGAIASRYGTDADTLMLANKMENPSLLGIGQVITIPGSGPRKIEGLRGILNITINKHEDGTQDVAYGFLANASSDPGGYMLLQGDNLQELQNYNSRPVDIWGTTDSANDGTIRTVKVERFKIPFPDLKVQIYQGTQKITEIGGQPATLFITEDGQTYVQLLSDGTTGPSLIGNAGDKVQVEAVAVPSETLGGYPALRIFGGGLATNPKNGQPTNLTITADKPSVISMPSIGKPTEAPTMTIDKVELVHYLSDPRYAVAQPNAQPPYFQPVWRFAGHYSNGDEFEILIQALQQQFLLPEVEQGLQPG